MLLNVIILSAMSTSHFTCFDNTQPHADKENDLNIEKDSQQIIKSKFHHNFATYYALGPSPFDLLIYILLPYWVLAWWLAIEHLLINQREDFSLSLDTLANFFSTHVTPSPHTCD